MILYLIGLISRLMVALPTMIICSPLIWLVSYIHGGSSHANLIVKETIKRSIFGVNNYSR